jgi:hypothetical protein
MSVVAIFVRGLTLAAAVLLAGCGSSDPARNLPPTAPTPSGPLQVRVYGSVVDFTTNTPVPRASIDFYIQGLPTIARSVITDAAGFYDVSLTRGVKYNPRINGPDVDSNRGTIIPVAKQTQADYMVNGGTCIVFYGTIRDAITGEPVSGAMVRFGATPHLSGSDGSYRLDFGCPTPATPWRSIGTTFMTVTSPGYVTQSPFGTRAEFIPGYRTQRIDVALQPEG